MSYPGNRANFLQQKSFQCNCNWELKAKFIRSGPGLMSQNKWEIVRSSSVCRKETKTEREKPLSKTARREFHEAGPTTEPWASSVQETTTAIVHVKSGVDVNLKQNICSV